MNGEEDSFVLTSEFIPKQLNKGRRLYLTADEHYFHTKIIKYCNRPFGSVQEMNEALVVRHNSLVRDRDCVIHIGDFSLSSLEEFISVIMRLNGYHFIMDGSHDMALNKFVSLKLDVLNDKLCILPKLYEFRYSGHKIALCHYAMLRWWASHHGSLHFFGHSHGKLQHPGRAMDVGVDTNEFYPYLIEDVIAKTLNKQQL